MWHVQERLAVPQGNERRPIAGRLGNLSQVWVTALTVRLFVIRDTAISVTGGF